MDVSRVQELLNKVADDAEEDVVERLGGNVVDDILVRAIFSAGWKRGEAKGFASGHAVGRQHLTVGWFFIIAIGLFVLGLTIGMGVGSGLIQLQN